VKPSTEAPARQARAKSVRFGKIRDQFLPDGQDSGRPRPLRSAVPHPTSVKFIFWPATIRQA
jgi:hypothetical protein